MIQRMNHPLVCDIMKKQIWKCFSNKGKSYVKFTSASLLKRWLSLTEKFFKKKQNLSSTHLKKF